MQEPLITVIVPIYNVEEYLERCIESIINQTYKNIEIILVDDGSKDNSAKLCDEYAKKDKRIKVIHKENGGVSSARNLALENMTGSFVSFIDGDDYIELNMYEELISKQKEADYNILIARYDEVTDDKITKITEKSLKDFCETADLTYLYNKSTKKIKTNNEVIIEDWISCSLCRMLIKSELLKNLKFNTKIRYAEDYVYFNELITKNNCKIGMVDKYFYHYYMRSNSASHTRRKDVLRNSKEYLNEISRVLKDTKYAKYILALEYTCYIDCFIAKYIYGDDINYEEFKTWGKKENYNQIKKVTKSLKGKIKIFLIKHKMKNLLKILYK